MVVLVSNAKVHSAVQIAADSSTTVQPLIKLSDTRLESLALPCHESVMVARPVSAPFDLPEEIMALIFQVARDLSEEDEFCAADLDKNRRIPHIPLLVSLVCRRWRDIAYAAPLLWTNLHVIFPWKLEVVSFWLTRSKSVPIHLRITAKIVERWGKKFATARSGKVIDLDNHPHHWPAIPYISSDSFQLVFNTFGDHFHRCRSITLDASHHFEHIITRFIKELGKASTTFPLLERFVLEREPPMWQETTQLELPGWVLLFVQGAPLLRDVRMGYRFSLPPSLSARITALHLQGTFFTLPELWDILPQFRRLRVLALHDGFKGQMSPMNQLRLPLLLSLHIYNTLHRSILFLQLIQAPNLRTLVLARLAADTLRGFHGAHPIHGERFPNLKEIMIPSLYGDRALHHAIKCFPGIERIGVSGPKFATSLLDLLVGNAYNIPWPKLHTLDILGEPEIICMSLGQDVIREVIESRSTGGVPLRKVHLTRRTTALMGHSFLNWMKGHLEVTVKDVWGEIQRDGLYRHRSY